MNFVEALGKAQAGLDKWRALPHNQRWWKKIDGTPIVNDLLVHIATQFTEPAKCHVCDSATEFACSDCRINLHATVNVCEKPACRDEHEKFYCAGPNPHEAAVRREKESR